METYVSAVLRAYLELRDTPSRARLPDRTLARSLYERGVCLDQVLAALLVAAGRRLARPPDAAKLGGIRSLAYFVPVIQELEGFENLAGYLDYLENSALGEMSRQREGVYTE